MMSFPVQDTSLTHMNRKAQAFQKDIPAVLVCDLAEVRHVTVMVKRIAKPVLLVTETEACARLGPGFLLAMTGGDGQRPDLVRALIDCGSDAGYAMLALRLGWREIHVTGAPESVVRIGEMTEAAGGRFHAILPVTFNFAESGPVDQRLEDWLIGDASN